VVLVNGPVARAHGPGWAGFFLKPGPKAHMACVMNRICLVIVRMNMCFGLCAQKAILDKVQKPVSRDKSWHFFNTAPTGCIGKAISAAYRREGDFGCGVVGHIYRAAAAIC
jgi:hypothetical protein